MRSEDIRVARNVAIRTPGFHCRLKLRHRSKDKCYELDLRFEEQGSFGEFANTLVPPDPNDYFEVYWEVRPACGI